MKKVRLTLRDNVAAWSFTLFDSPEAVYYLGTSTPEPEDDFCCSVTLSPGDYMEVEWMGAEYVHNGDNVAFVGPDDSERYERIRLAKSYAIERGTILKGSGYVETYSGWVPGEVIPWLSKRHKYLKVTRINDRNKPKLNLSELFEEPESAGSNDKKTSSHQVVLN